MKINSQKRLVDNEFVEDIVLKVISKPQEYKIKGKTLQKIKLKDAGSDFVYALINSSGLTHEDMQKLNSEGDVHIQLTLVKKNKLVIKMQKFKEHQVVIVNSNLQIFVREEEAEQVEKESLKKRRENPEIELPQTKAAKNEEVANQEEEISNTTSKEEEKPDGEGSAHLSIRSRESRKDTPPPSTQSKPQSHKDESSHPSSQGKGGEANSMKKQISELTTNFYEMFKAENRETTSKTRLSFYIEAKVIKKPPTIQLNNGRRILKFYI